MVGLVCFFRRAVNEGVSIFRQEQGRKTHLIGIECLPKRNMLECWRVCGLGTGNVLSFVKGASDAWI